MREDERLDACRLRHTAGLEGACVMRQDALLESCRIHNSRNEALDSSHVVKRLMDENVGSSSERYQIVGGCGIARDDDGSISCIRTIPPRLSGAST